MATIIKSVLLIVVWFFIIKALPAAIDQNLDSYRAGHGINRAEILARSNQAALRKR